MRPALTSGLPLLWRNGDTLQIGVDPRRAVALTGMRAAAPLLSLLDGSRNRPQVLAAANDLGIDGATADRVLSLLAQTGLLHDRASGVPHTLSPGLRARLEPELATAALAHGDTDGGARTLARRREARVRVHGGSPAALAIASLLTTAGIGLVISTGFTAGGGHDDGTSRPASGPRLVPPGQRGQRGQRAPARPVRQPDLVILADTYRRDLAGTLARRGVPHLAALASEAIGVVGPLVTPGRSACLRCLDLTRAERDPAWPVLLAQLAGGGTGPPGCDSVLAAAVAAQTAFQALLAIDRGRPPAAVKNGTLELVLPDWRWRRRTWPPHPRCECVPRASA